MPRLVDLRARRIMRHLRVRKRVRGTPGRPRLSVFRSLKQIYAQVIDDTTGRTLVAASSRESEVAAQKNGKTKSQAAHLVGTLLAQRARTAGVSRVVFDRGGFKYHGRVKALAEGAREGGLEL
ncbi:MAG: 50S ribosomal protein L18 [Chloroflexi bacterium]|nr:50S ribosomal protein L18 [Chloroflexota bacterium]